MHKHIDVSIHTQKFMCNLLKVKTLKFYFKYICIHKNPCVCLLVKVITIEIFILICVWCMNKPKCKKVYTKIFSVKVITIENVILIYVCCMNKHVDERMYTQKSKCPLLSQSNNY